MFGIGDGVNSNMFDGTVALTRDELPLLAYLTAAVYSGGVWLYEWQEAYQDPGDGSLNVLFGGRIGTVTPTIMQPAVERSNRLVPLPAFVSLQAGWTYQGEATFTFSAGDAVGGTYISVNGVPVAGEPVVNIVPTNGVTVVAVDNPSSGRVDITYALGGNITSNTTITTNFGFTLAITGAGTFTVSTAVFDIDSPTIALSLTTTMLTIPTSATFVLGVGLSVFSAFGITFTTNSSDLLTTVTFGAALRPLPALNIYTTTGTVNLPATATFTTTGTSGGPTLVITTGGGATITSYTIGTSGTPLPTYTRWSTTQTIGIPASGTYTVTSTGTTPTIVTTTNGSGVITSQTFGSSANPIATFNIWTTTGTLGITATGTHTITSTGANTPTLVITTDGSGLITSYVIGLSAHPLPTYTLYATTATFATTTLALGTLSGAVVTLGGGATAAALRFLEPSGSGTNYASFEAPALAGNTPYILPDAYPASNGYVLSSTTGGTLSWVANGGTPTLAYQQSTLGSDYTLTTSYSDTGLSLSIPGAGTYLLSGEIVGTHNSDSVSAASFNAARFYDVTNAAQVGDIVTVVTGQVNSLTNVQTAPIGAVYTASGAATIRLEGKYQSMGSTVTAKFQANTTDGFTRIRFLQIA